MTQNRSAKTVFITGMGTGVGKTYISAIIAGALQADYWKPVQAGFEGTTDTQWVSNITGIKTHREAYKLKLAASPHIAAREENINISIPDILKSMPDTGRNLVIEGAGGLMVPLNENEFVADLIIAMDVPVILVSRNMLGSINHSLLTAMACREKGIKVLGWVFNDDYLNYENEIVKWSGVPSMGSIPFHPDPDKEFIREQGNKLRNKLEKMQW
jgi:dethiobiotin synthetase